MHIQRLYRVSMLMLAVVVGGCASGPQLPPYVEPTAAESELAIVKGHGGTVVLSVDNLKAPGSFFYSSNIGGNKVRLEPGRHTLVIHHSTSSNNVVRNREVTMVHHFEAGHKYKVGPKSMIDHTLVLHDETTKQDIMSQ